MSPTLGSYSIPLDAPSEQRALFIKDTAFYATPDSEYGKFYIDVFNELPAKTTYPGFMETIAQWRARGGIKVKLFGDSQQYENWSTSDGIEYVSSADLMDDMYAKNLPFNPEFLDCPVIIDVSDETKEPKLAYALWGPKSQRARNDLDVICVPRDLTKWLFSDARDYYGFRTKVWVGSHVAVALQNPKGHVSEREFVLCKELDKSREKSLSAKSPLGRKLLGKFPGDTFFYQAPAGSMKCEVLWVSPNPVGMHPNRVLVSSLDIGKIDFMVRSMTKMYPELQWFEDFVKCLRDRESSSCSINCRSCSDLSYTMCIDNCMQKRDECRYCATNKDNPLFCSLLLAQDIELLEGTCIICGYPLDRDGLCSKFYQHVDDLVRTIVVGIYRPYHQGQGRLLESLLSKMILGFKSNPCLVIPLGNLMVSRLLRENLPVGTVVTGVPAHEKDIESSGFDRVGLLCQWISLNLGLRYEPDLITKTRYGSSRTDREDSLFECTKDLSMYNTVLLVDDVATTFSTLGRCAKSLREAGVSQVIGCSLSRTVG